MKTNRAFVEIGSDRKLGDTNGMSMGFRDTARMHMTETLMPENAKLIASQVVEDKRAIVGGK